MSTNSGVSSTFSGISSSSENDPDEKIYRVAKSKKAKVIKSSDIKEAIKPNSKDKNKSKDVNLEKESFTFKISSEDYKLSVVENFDGKKDSKNILNKKISKSPNLTERSLDLGRQSKTAAVLNSDDLDSIINCNSMDRKSRNCNNHKNTDIITPLSETCDNVNENQKKNGNQNDCNSVSTIVEVIPAKMKKPRVPTNQNSKKNQNSNEERTNGAKNSPPDANNRVYTKCGNCKGLKNSDSCHSKSKPHEKNCTTDKATLEKSKKINSSPIKKLSRSALAIESEKTATSNLSKYSPCASRLAACSKILSSDSVNNVDSPIHVARLKSPSNSIVKNDSDKNKKLPALSLLNIQQFQKNQRSTRSKSTSECCLTPMSDGTNLSYSPTGTEILSLEEVAPQVSMPDVSKSSKKKSEKKLFGNSRTVALEVSVDGGRYKSKYQNTLPP